MILLRTAARSRAVGWRRAMPEPAQPDRNGADAAAGDELTPIY